MSSEARTAETFEEVLRQRRSIRGFLPDPVPAGVIRRVFAAAQLAPSNCNVQPWVVHVVSGASAVRLRQALHDHAASGAGAEPDYPLTGGYPGLYRTRQVDAAKALFAATGVGRDDVEARTRSFLRNFRFFDAPHAAFIFLPDWAGMREAADAGMYAQSLMLALTANGLASCAQGALSHHAPVVHRELGVGPELKLLFGLAFGYADPDHPANAALTTRLPVEEAVAFHD
jgi:nitroreductase